MARMIYLSEEVEQQEFAKRAAKDFAEHPEHSTYGDLKPGSLLALRWGLGGDCVLIVKLDDDFVSTNYQSLIKLLPKSNYKQGWGSPPTTTKPEASDWEWPGHRPSTPVKETLGCFGTYDETEPECTIKCQKDGLMEGCKKEWEAKVAQRKVAKGLYR